MVLRSHSVPAGSLKTVRTVLTNMTRLPAGIDSRVLGLCGESVPAQFERPGDMIMVGFLPDVAFSDNLWTYNWLINQQRVPPFE
jgi:hypothetical protein